MCSEGRVVHSGYGDNFGKTDFTSMTQLLISIHRCTDLGPSQLILKGPKFCGAVYTGCSGYSARPYIFSYFRHSRQILTSFFTTDFGIRQLT